MIGVTPPPPKAPRTASSSLVRGWLFPGALVDVGTTGDTDALATDAVINAVDYSNPAAPTVTMPGAIATTGGTHYFYIANPNSATAPNPELNGLRQIVGSGALGGLNPSTAGQEYWRGAFRDTTTTTFSLDLALNLQRYVLQNSNQPGTRACGPATGSRRTSTACCRIRCSSRVTRTSRAGNVSRPKWNGMSVDAFADILDTDWYQLTLKDLVRVKGAIDQPKWASDMDGGGQSISWQSGTTRFGDGLLYPTQVGCQRRNTQAGRVRAQVAISLRGRLLTPPRGAAPHFPP